MSEVAVQTDLLAGKRAALAQLASLRHTTHRRVHGGDLEYGQPEDYWEFDFRAWVSPYTKTAGNLDAGVLLVLQDWSSHDSLAAMSPRLVEPTRRYGFTPETRTNLRLQDLLRRHFGLELSATYTTNLFPLIKPHGMSWRIPDRDLVWAATTFTLEEIRIVRPRVVLALGRQVATALRAAGADVHALPHPAARTSTAAREAAWADAARLHATPAPAPTP